MRSVSTSVRRTLFAKLLPSLIAATLACCAAAYGLSNHFSQRVLDQWLLDSAMSLVKQVHAEHGKTTISVTADALEIFEWDAVDRIYYEIESAREGRILGNARIPYPPRQTVAGGRPVFYDAAIAAAGVRGLAMAVATADGDVVQIRMAETRNKRGLLTNDVLVSTLIVSVFVVAVVGYIIWRGIGTGIALLENAVRDIRSLHGASPLSPIDEAAVPSEVVPLVQDLNELVGELATTLREKQRFVADAAHQLRTPFASMRVQLELARRESNPARHQAAIDSALAVIGNTTRMLHQLLTLARVDESPAGLAVNQRINVVALVRDEVERRSDEVWNASGDIGYEGPSTPVFVKGNEALLREAVANLLDNACKHAGGGIITAGVIADPPEVFVEDNGPGIPVSERDRVRDRFYRIPDGTSDGCGLGLAIVEEIAKHHHATLILDAARGGQGLLARINFGKLAPGRPAPDAA
ncbi:MAG: sensor histidine kinase N-terminal domain-containing protein [Rhodocyclaceae bacterium]|nr:sensor histidine kinase N-terminal domain-containing protein [Rhodocyclaceae bacterium]